MSLFYTSLEDTAAKETFGHPLVFSLHEQKNRTGKLRFPGELCLAENYISLCEECL